MTTYLLQVLSQLDDPAAEQSGRSVAAPSMNRVVWRFLLVKLALSGQI
jgi:hypothetical protein